MSSLCGHPSDVAEVLRVEAPALSPYTLDGFVSALGQVVAAERSGELRLSAARVPEYPVSGLVSDFEGEKVSSTFGAGWMVSTDTLTGGKSRAEFGLVEGGAEGSAKALLVSGEVPALGGVRRHGGSGGRGEREEEEDRRAEGLQEAKAHEAEVSRSVTFAPVARKPGKKETPMLDRPLRFALLATAATFLQTDCW